jgi:D-cysteine desulfhydrase
MGGNKTRKLEYLIADALAERHQRVVTYGGLQSNHAPMTAAAARRFGLEPHLFYFERRPRHLVGNQQLNVLFDAKTHFIPIGGGGTGTLSLEIANRMVRWVALLRVGRHYFIPVGGHTWRGCLGYVRAALEIDEQTRELGLENATLIVAAGSGGTLSGLMAGITLLGSRIRLLGIDVGNLWRHFRTSIARMATELCSRLDEPCRFRGSDVPLIEDVYVGPRYGIPSENALAAIRYMASSEGILLDPVYTGKAFAGLLDLVEQEKLPSGTPVIFLHTGGGPSLFAFSEQLASTVNPSPPKLRT